MSTLHVLSHSPFGDTRLTSCLRVTGPGDGILLCGDASYALMASSAPRQALEAQAGEHQVYILDEDAKARSIALPSWVTSVDYPGFVALSIQYDKVNTWL